MTIEEKKKWFHPSSARIGLAICTKYDEIELVWMMLVPS